MANKLVVSELDFESIKTNLKTYLQGQTTFQDYDFEGSGLAVLIDLLAYNTHYAGYYSNMVANEMFLDTALVRNSILSHAKTLNYTPVSRRGAVANVSVVVTPPGANTQTSLTMDRFQTFLSGPVDGVNYLFITTESKTVTKEANTFSFKNLHLTQGIPQLMTLTYNQAVNTANTFILPNDDIDTSSLLVVVQTSSANTTSTTFTSASDITTLTANTTSYFLTCGTDSKYSVTFGDGVIGKKLANGNIVLVSYLTTDGDPANLANTFTTDSIGGFTTITTTSQVAAAGGADRENLDAIKFHAPLAYTSQNRAVTLSDYETLIPTLYPNIQSVKVWGGEDNDPPIYGKVFIAFQLKSGYLINEVEKTRILDDLIGPKALVTVKASFVDPDYVYLNLVSSVSIDTAVTTQSVPTILAAVRTAITTYMDTINSFGSIFVHSKLQKAIDAVSTAIRGSSTLVRIQKRFTPTLSISKNYTIDFGFALHRGGPANRMESTGLNVLDATGVQRLCFLGELANSFTGIDELLITNPGFSYVDVPTITITGDGTGATATVTLLNGQIAGVTLVSRGTGYTRATVTVSGGGGAAAVLNPVVATRFGTLDLFYYNSLGEKVTLTASIGTVNYETGRVTLTNLKPVSTDTTDSSIRLSFESASILTATKNQIFQLDATDISSLVVEQY